MNAQPLLPASIRERFVMPDARYFLSHSIGVQPAGAGAAMADAFMTPWARSDGAAWDHWLAAIETFRASLAPVIGAAPRDICPQTNVSSALTKILFALPERARRRKIVLTEDDFPTIGFVAAQATRMGYELVFLPGGSRLADPESWSPAFHDDVQALLITHVFSNSSVRAPAAELCERAMARGVFTVLDIAQSAGAVPVRLDDWRPDFAIGTSVKYLCGGPGAAFLWVQPETAARTAPLDVGWFSHAKPFEFDIHSFQYAEDSLRFWGGTPSVAPFAVASAGPQILSETGMDAVDAHNQALLGRLLSQLPEGAVRSHAGEGSRGASALIGVRDIEKASAALKEADIIHDARAGALRFSVHLYTSDGDVDALCDILREFA